LGVWHGTCTIDEVKSVGNGYREWVRL
jgi:hypothetical protein